MDQPLSRGASELLRRLTFLSQQRGYAFPSQEYLAAKMGCDVRTIKRYVRELKDSGHIVATKRQHLSAKYEIQKGQNVPSGVPSDVPSGRPLPLGFSEYKTLGPSRKEPMQEFPEGEKQAVTRAIEVCGFEATPDLLSKLARKAGYYRVTGLVVAAHIERARRKVEGTSNTPQGPGWILAVTENALRPESKPVASAAAAHSEPTDQGRHYGDTGIDIAALAASKRFPR